MNRVGMTPIAKSVLKYINITSIAYLHCLLRFCQVWFCWFQNSWVAWVGLGLFDPGLGRVGSIVGLVACSMSASPTYTASMTISKTERSRVQNIYWNAVTPAFPLARHTFMGTPFPCKNICGNGVPMRSRPTTPLTVRTRGFVLEWQ